MSEVCRRFVKANGINFAVHESGQEYQAQQPTLVLVHATGFHGRCWDQVIQRLGDRHVIAVDQRGHGASEQKSFSNWSEFGDDLAALLTALELSGVEAVGHSMGGHASVAAAAQNPSLFSKLLLIDPVILDPSFYPMWDEQELNANCVESLCPLHP